MDFYRKIKWKIRSSKIGFAYQRFKADWCILKDMWNIVSVDCRQQLIIEFLINPNELRQRHREELRFNQRLRNWENKK